MLFLIHWAFFSIERIEPGELIAQEQSPDGRYTVKTYLNNGGATVSYSVLGVLEFNEQNKKPKNIYWQYKTEEGVILWKDDTTVQINGVLIEVPNGKYDYRHP
ncbi:DUF5412 family protein [Jeotgalibacillus proteolyticus]|uniref:DUF5412 domain-containing protein n=1 Tax=Jeotgalibacillus proteolyticus TaxID=2082395 RepID=A0A2S5GFA0_9BACL|nr:DUF5412 family protein [Jeotgalibacillus proteolyticus]PPA71659.1 hypothetical protein C4B60_06280 [Jeotgalibacillus proteolyticus]